MKWVFIPNLTKKYLIFIWFLLSSLTREMDKMFLGDKFYKSVDTREKKMEINIIKRFFEIVFNVGCDCLTGVLLLFSTIRNIKESSEKTENNKEKIIVRNLYIYNEESKRSIKSLIKRMICLSFVDFLCQIPFMIFVFFFENDEIIPNEYYGVFLSVDIVSRNIFSRLMLGTYFYRHHTVSFIMILFGAFLSGSIDLPKIFEEGRIGGDNKELPIFLIILVLQYILYSLEDVINKIILDEQYLTPYALLSLKGIFEIPYFLVLIIVLFLTGKIPFTFNEVFNSEYIGRRIIMRIIFVISNICRSVFLIQIIDKFSSPYFSVVKVGEFLLFYLVILIFHPGKEDQEQEILEKAISIITLIIWIISTLMHNEIIVVTVCGLDEYTQFNFDKQAENDIKDAFGYSDRSNISGDESESDSYSNDASFNTQNLSGSD